MKKHKIKLRNTQKLLHSYITDPNESRKKSKIIDLSLIKKSHTGLLPQDRLNIYKDMYVARLIEVLEIDYVFIKHLLGKEFYKTMCEYIEMYPSQSNTLNYYGKNLPKFFRKKKSKNSRLFFEIASLEWQVSAMLFNSEESISFNSEDFANLEMSNQQQLKFIKNDTLKLFKFKYPVNKLLTQLIKMRKSLK